MIPLATVSPSSPDLSFNPARAFEHDLNLFQEKYTDLWLATPTHSPTPGEVWTRRGQRQVERETQRLIDEIEDEMRGLRSNETAQAGTRRRLQKSLRRYGQTALALPVEQCAVIFSDDYFNVTAEFARRAREFDDQVEIHDISQALRNLWIMGLFQLFLDHRISLTPAMLGYSLLYPYTDNQLDDPAISPAGKKRICERLEQRLRGQAIEAENNHEHSVFDLVGMIEQQFDRDDFPKVYSSLLAIHQAQLASLRQHSAEVGDEILGLSIMKGGTSVLADGYLVAGHLTPDEADFFFGYGIVLQLIDDLQDVQSDLETKHLTLFSQRATSGPLDELTSQLHHFLAAVLDRSRRFSDRRFDVLKDVVRRNCSQLLVQAAAQNPQFFSSEFLRQFEIYSPVRFSYARKKSGDVLKRFARLNRGLRRRTTLGSLFEALGQH